MKTTTLKIAAAAFVLSAIYTVAYEFLIKDSASALTAALSLAFTQLRGLLHHQWFLQICDMDRGQLLYTSSWIYGKGGDSENSAESYRL